MKILSEKTSTNQGVTSNMANVSLNHILESDKSGVEALVNITIWYSFALKTVQPDVFEELFYLTFL